MLGEKPLKTLRLGQSIRAKLLVDFRRLPRSADPVARRWEKWLRGADPLLPVTFEQETAAAEPKAVHLDVLHPLVRQAAHHLQRSGAVQTNLTVSTESVPPGVYPFALYQWRKVGVRAEDTLVAITEDPKLDAAVLSMLEETADVPNGTPPDTADAARLDERHHGLWRAARANHMAENRDLVQHREQSLTASHMARRKLLEDQIDGATNDKIRRMKDAYSGEADHRFRREADHPVRSSRSPVGAKRRGGSIMPFSDRLGSMASSSFASILL